ncbi:response regulator transcription factor [Paremcibacter congregatus]|uniref:DNA-binding response regulator n=1 Tax=Paremcibacter congregatus TaxID=2043170 RepID=A0A2G4YTN5_9PROT|nr:response regulator transcription factor [Paremcibacter congregatus]PHZ85694.1 DNA-binding response regulator [Paremcibacter congregatus]QDE26654.1 response regulator transcription factor [Paremcibacter congregatus]|tara:strand:- start:784 stop:1458 length:675 start_codon:yes stop_codon:yes gene_type:complete
MRLLLVEDDPDLSRQMKMVLEEDGYAVDVSFDGEEGHYLGETETYDAIVLDLGLPVMDGLSVLNKWRQAGIDTPVLILTARDGWSEKVSGLDAGADDYVTKPFKIEEVLARVRALIRRAAGQSSPELSCGDVTLNTTTSKVTLNGDPIRLTAQEYKLLAYMMHHPEKIISRTELTEHIYDQDFDRDSNTIEVFVTRVRKKLGVNIIQTVRGLGYQLVNSQEENN